MAFYRVTNKRDGSSKDVVFDGTIQQFVMSQFSGRGVPDQHMVSEVLAPAPVADVVVEAEVVKPKSTKKGVSK